MNIPIVLASDENYAPYMYVTILSCLETKKPETKYDFFCLIPGAFSPACKDAFNQLEKQYSGCRIQFIDMKDQFTDAGISIPHISIPTYYRLAMPSLLKEYDKAIYLDTDIIVCRDLSEMYSIDMGQNFIGGVQAIGYMTWKAAEKYYRELGMRDLSTYINAGVTLWNLDLIRSENKEAELHELAGCNLQSQDQDAVNLAFYKRALMLPLKYNLMIKYMHQFTHMGDFPLYGQIFGEDAVKEALNSPVIIHYADKVKPWSDSSIPYAEHWWKYVDKLPAIFRKAVCQLPWVLPNIPGCKCQFRKGKLTQLTWRGKNLYEKKIKPENKPLNNTNTQMSTQLLKACLNRPLVSIIVPVYNSEQYLAECLDSILNQTYPDLDIICVNDGSTDNSAAILQQYAEKDSRIRIITKENGGLSSARNAGLEVATGAWVTGVDSDDTLEADTIASCLQYMNCEEVDLICYGVNRLDRTNGRSRDRYIPGKEGITSFSNANILSYRCYFPNKLWKTDIIRQQNLKFLKGVWWEDIAFFYSYLPHVNKLAHVASLKYNYMYDAANDSIINKAHTGDPRVKSILTMLDTVLSYYDTLQLPLPIDRADENLIKTCYNAIISYLSTNSDDEELLDEMWDEFRAILKRHGSIGRLRKSWDICMMYYCHPRLRRTINERLTSINNTNNSNTQTKPDTATEQNIARIMCYDYLQKQYRRIRLKKFFSVGKKRKKYKQQLANLREYIRAYRSLRREFIERMFQFK